MTEPRDLLVASGDVTLAGSLWLPDTAPSVGIVMHPGSGPSDRDNGGYFVSLRSALVTAGFAVASFDKRGVGGSSGRWQDAPIETQARDVLACIEALSGEEGLAGARFGVFGHSQGGWVAVETAARSTDIPFVIISSGPAVTPAAQERHAARLVLEASDAGAEEVERGLARYDLMVRLARALTPYSEVEGRKDELAPHLPKDASIWRFWISILDYDPKSALTRTHTSILALYGEDDRVVPVAESVDVLHSVVPPTRLSVEVFPGANHRVQVGDPPQLAPGYVEKVLDFLESHSQS